MGNDGSRVFPVNVLGIHHAVSDFMVNWSDLSVQDWFSNNGKQRAYQNGAINSFHEHPGRPGQLTYSQAHYCLHEYTSDGNKYGWRLTELIKRPFENVAWHIGVWSINQRSIGIETAGNYLGRHLPDKALMLIADAFRAHDISIGGVLEIIFHKQVIATACPGNISEQYDKIIDMFNNPKKWNDILWPAPVVPKWSPMAKPREMVAVSNINVINLDNNSVAGSISSGKKTPFVEVKEQGGKTYLRSQWSKDNNKNWGVDIAGLGEVHVPVIETNEEGRSEQIPFLKTRVADDSMLIGEEEVEPGVNGLVTIVDVVTYTDGKETARKEKSRGVTSEPKDEVTRYGTKPKDDKYPSWFVDFFTELFDGIKLVLDNIFRKGK